MGNSVSSTTNTDTVDKVTPLDGQKILNIQDGGITNLGDGTGVYGSTDKAYTKETVNDTTSYKLNSQYFSDDTIKDISRNTINSTFQNKPNDYLYLTCDQDCLDKMQENSTLPSNLKEDENLHIDDYNKLKSLDEEIYNTESIASKYYILMIIWFIIAIIILFVFIVTLMSNDNQISMWAYYIVMLFLFYCFYNIFINIYK